MSRKGGPEDISVLLNTFVVLAKVGTFTSAARVMSLSNETATMYRLKALEKYLGTKLFTRKRGGRGVRTLYLTESGRELYGEISNGSFNIRNWKKTT